MVYRIDYPYSSVNLMDSPNNNKGKPAVTIVPADGLLISSYSINGTTVTNTDYTSSLGGDPYPGKGNVTELTSVKLNNSTLTTAPLYNIAEDTESGLVTLSFIDPNATAIKSIATHSEANGHIYTIDGRYAGNTTNQLPRGLYIKDGKKIVIK